MIKYQREVYSWEFVFLGAKQDAISAGAKMGIPIANAVTLVKRQVVQRELLMLLAKSQQHIGPETQITHYTSPRLPRRKRHNPPQTGKKSPNGGT